MTSFDYFREWLRGESAAAWAQCLLATMTLAATFVVANLPIWAQAKAARARQTQLEGALIALTWRVGGLAQSLVNQIADPLKRPKLAKNEHVMLMEPDVAFAELASFPKIELEDPLVRYRLDVLKASTRRVRNNIRLILEQERSEDGVHDDWIGLVQHDFADLKFDLEELAGAVGVASYRRNPRNPVIHSMPGLST